jgi:hypothetical protein
MTPFRFLREHNPCVLCETDRVPAPSQAFLPLVNVDSQLQSDFTTTPRLPPKLITGESTGVNCLPISTTRGVHISVQLRSALPTSAKQRVRSSA